MTPKFYGYELDRVTATAPELTSEHITTVLSARQAGRKAGELTSPHGASVWLRLEGSPLALMPKT